MITHLHPLYLPDDSCVLYILNKDVTIILILVFNKLSSSNHCCPLLLCQGKATSCTSAQPLQHLVTVHSWRVVGCIPNLEPSVCSSSSTTPVQLMMFLISGCESMTQPTWSFSRAFQVVNQILHIVCTDWPSHVGLRRSKMVGLISVALTIVDLTELYKLKHLWVQSGHLVLVNSSITSTEQVFSRIFSISEGYTVNQCNTSWYQVTNSSQLHNPQHESVLNKHFRCSPCRKCHGLLGAA